MCLHTGAGIVPRSEMQVEMNIWSNSEYAWWLGDCELLGWTLCIGLQRSLMADHLHCSCVRSRSHCSWTSAAPPKHCTARHSSFEPGQQSRLLSPQHQAGIFPATQTALCLRPDPPTPWTPPLAMAFHLRSVPCFQTDDLLYTRTKQPIPWGSGIMNCQI